MRPTLTARAGGPPCRPHHPAHRLWIPPSASSHPRPLGTLPLRASVIAFTETPCPLLLFVLQTGPGHPYSPPPLSSVPVVTSQGQRPLPSLHQPWAHRGTAQSMPGTGTFVGRDRGGGFPLHPGHFLGVLHQVGPIPKPPSHPHLTPWLPFACVLAMVVGGGSAPAKGKVPEVARGHQEGSRTGMQGGASQGPGAALEVSL